MKMTIDPKSQRKERVGLLSLGNKKGVKVIGGIRKAWRSIFRGSGSRVVLESLKDPKEQERKSRFYEALFLNDRKKLKGLFEEGLDINHESMEMLLHPGDLAHPLIVAASQMNCQPETLRLLMEKGKANINAQSSKLKYTALMCAVMRRDQKSVAVLLEYNPNTFLESSALFLLKETALEMAVSAGSDDILKVIELHRKNQIKQNI